MARVIYEDSKLVYLAEVYSRNDEKIYDMMCWCAKAMVKRAKRGEVNLKEHLVNTSTVSKIVTMVKRQMLPYEPNLLLTRANMVLLKKTVADELWDIYEDYLYNGEE